MKRRVVITGMGAVSPIGNNVDDMWQSAKDGVSGIDFIKNFDTVDHKVKIAGEVKNLDLTQYIDKKELRRMAKFTQFALVAAKEALAQSNITPDPKNPSRYGVNVSSGIGGLDAIESETKKAYEKGCDRVSPFFIPMTIVNMAAGMIAIECGFKGSCTSVITACASSTNSVGESFRNIRDGYADVMLCGGTECTVTPLGIGGFTAMKALCESTDPKRGSMPFDKDRSGFVMGEGAGILILEELEHAKARGAKILGEVVGYGSSCDAHHMTAPLEDGSGAALCMTVALDDAGITPADVDYINAHGTSTPLNDKGETIAVKSAFGEHAYKLAMSSTKSMTGHLLGAAGAIEAIFCAKALENDFIPPTIGYQEADPDCDLDIVPNKGREQKITYAMSNSLGFGGHNASLVLKKYSEV